MCELCKKQVAADINNRNADTILKMSLAVATLNSQNFGDAAKKVAAALVKLLPQETKTSGETHGQSVGGGSNPKYQDDAPDPASRKEEDKPLPVDRALVDALAKSMGINPDNLLIIRA